LFQIVSDAISTNRALTDTGLLTRKRMETIDDMESENTNSNGLPNEK